MDEISIQGVTLTRYGMLYLEEYETAVVADLHIGYEDVMASKGVFFPKIQKKHLLDILDRIYRDYDPSILIVNGDFKHEFSRNTPQEWDEVEEVLDFILDMGNVIVVRGNHDNYLRGILRRKGVKMEDEYRVGNYRFLHGHRDANLEGIVVMGHEHPSITLRDSVMASVKIPCFLYSENLIVLPALSIYASGTDVLKNDFVSPILKKNKVDFEVFGVDEVQGVIPLGTLSSLQSLPGD